MHTGTYHMRYYLQSSSMLGRQPIRGKEHEWRLGSSDFILGFFMFPLRQCVSQNHQGEAQQIYSHILSFIQLTLFSRIRTSYKDSLFLSSPFFPVHSFFLNVVSVNLWVLHPENETQTEQMITSHWSQLWSWLRSVSHWGISWLTITQS